MSFLSFLYYNHIVFTSDVIRFNSLPYYVVSGSNITITCSIDANRLIVLLDNSIHVKIKHRVSNKLTYCSTIFLNYGNRRNYSSDCTLSNVKLSDAGEYTCAYYRTTSNPFITIEPVVNTTATALTVQSKLYHYLTLFVYEFIYSC